MTANNEDEFGTAQIDAEFEGYKFFKLRSPDPKKGETQTEFICRILPPMKSYKATGKWAFFYGQHYGFAGVNTRDPNKPRQRPFGCLQEKDNRTGKILKRCPKCEQISACRSRIEDREQDLKRSRPGADEQSLKETFRNDPKLRAEKEWLSSHNCDKKFWMNIMALDGTFGVLQLSYRTFTNKLKPALREWAEKKRIDAFALDKGVWIRFTRIGQRLNVEDGVDLYMENVDLGNGEMAEKPRSAPLSVEQRQRASKVCPDLSTGVVKMLTVEQIQALVDCSGEPEAVDAIWDGPKQKAQDSDMDDGNDELLNEIESAPSSQLSSEDEETALLARAKAIQERKAAESALAAQATQQAAKKPPTDPSEDFLSKFQPKQ